MSPRQQPTTKEVEVRKDSFQSEELIFVHQGTTAIVMTKEQARKVAAKLVKVAS